MSKPTPPIIRSTKAFSVEIPEGSNSAKARRSDVVASDDLDIQRKPTQFHEAAPEPNFGDGVQAGADAKDRLAYSASLEEAARRHQEEAANAAKDRLVSGLQATAGDNLQSIEGSANADNLAHIPATDADARNLQALPDEALRDRLAQEAGGALKDTRATGLAQNNPLADRFGHEAHSGLQDRQAGINQEAIKDKLAGVTGAEAAANRIGLPGEQSSQAANAGLAGDALKDNLQVVANEALKDNHQGLEDEALRDNLQGLADDALKDNQQGLEDEALKDNLQGLADEALNDNHQGLEDDALRDNLQGLADEALKDNHLGIEDEGLKDNHQGLEDEALKDNHQGLEDEALKDNLQGLADDALKNNKQGLEDEALSDNLQPLEDAIVSTRKDRQDKAHVQDHIVNLPPTQRALAPGPSPHQSSTTSPADTRDAAPVAARKGSAGHPAGAAPVSPATLASHAALSKAEQAKRMEEFHGRVEAIRKSVSGINHLLDDLQDKH